ncbi:MAG TPA: glycosyltransferase family 2 protein, partial [Phototrophicaceae bacterium]|nr:glycosyltransferase family 2 protein [Phototrophicaceae bacterium]
MPDSTSDLDLAIVIVTWNVRDLIQDALRTLYIDLATSGLSAQVYVVDSASSDDTVAIVREHFPQVNLTTSADNLGFGKANNLGMRLAGFGTPVGAHRHTPPRAAYLLNPDTLTKPGATRKLYDALMANPRVGLVGARLSYADGSFQHGAFAFPGLRQLWVEFFPTPGRLIEGRFNGRYPRALYDSGQPFEVDFTLGATMMIKREVIEQTGMFDEQIFMYVEETDWAWRIQEAGWITKCVPAAEVVHLVGQSTGQVRARSIVDLWTSRLYVFGKHYPA